jgi:hypothetical protein
MKKEQELSAINSQSSEIKTKEGMAKGMVSIVYLNPVYPKKYKDYEYFYMCLYLNDDQSTQNLNFITRLNNKTPISIKELKKTNEFSYLTPIHNGWNKYYLVKFKEDKKSKINFIIEDGDFKSKIMTYDKDEE